VEILSYIGVVRRRILIILFLTFLGGGSTLFFAMRQAKVYEATATLLINVAAPSNAIPYLSAAISGSNSQSPVQQLASSYDVYLKSSPFDALVIRKLHLVTTPAKLSKQISSNLISNTNFYTISAQAETPSQAANIANAVAQLFIEQNLTTLQNQQAAAAAKGPSASLTSRVLAELASVSALDASLSRRKDSSSPAIQARLATLETRMFNLTSTYNQLVSADSATSRQGLNTATLTGPADVPAVPVSPTPNRDAAFGTVAGLLLGLLLAFMLEYFDYALRTPEDVEHATGQLPLATIAFEIGRRRKRRAVWGVGETPNTLPLSGGAGAGIASATLFSLSDPRSPLSEAFRTLRTNLAFSNLNKPARSVVVTSVLPGEGKTTIASNLAIVLAQSGKKVILVDADLRRPSIHHVFQVSKATGFTDVLLANEDLDHVLRESGTPNLLLLTSGPLPSNPAELLSSEAMPELIAALLTKADMVIFDTPPMGAFTDAVVLSAQVEGSLMVARSGATRPNVVANGIAALQNVGARPLGVVLNMVELAALRDNSYYHYYTKSGEYAESKHNAHMGSARV
jgi:capsular exopolysaccharide synthesis family protein